MIFVFVVNFVLFLFCKVVVFVMLGFTVIHVCCKVRFIVMIYRLLCCCICNVCVYSSTEERSLADYLELKQINQSINYYS